MSRWFRERRCGLSIPTANSLWTPTESQFRVANWEAFSRGWWFESPERLKVTRTPREGAHNRLLSRTEIQAWRLWHCICEPNNIPIVNSKQGNQIALVTEAYSWTRKVEIEHIEATDGKPKFSWCRPELSGECPCVDYLGRRWLTSVTASKNR